MKRRTAPKGYRLSSSVTVDPGSSWGAQLVRGELVRFVDLEGQQAVDFLCYNASDTRDRYNAANTMKMAENVYLNTAPSSTANTRPASCGSRPSSCPNHDTIGGCCSVEMNWLRYAKRTHSCRATSFTSSRSFAWASRTSSPT